MAAWLRASATGRAALTTLAARVHPAGQAAAQELSAASLAASTPQEPPVLRSFYKRQLPHELIPFASPEVRDCAVCSEPSELC